MKNTLLNILIFILLTACTTTSETDNTQLSQINVNTQILNNFISDFNDRNLAGMMASVSNDVQWLSINGKELSSVTNSKQELEKSLAEYFINCSSCKSSIGNMLIMEDRISVTETISWERDGKKSSQGSLSVYEFNNGLIKRVYYFPAETIN